MTTTTEATPDALVDEHDDQQDKYMTFVLNDNAGFKTVVCSEQGEG